MDGASNELCTITANAAFIDFGKSLRKSDMAARPPDEAPIAKNLKFVFILTCNFQVEARIEIFRPQY